MPADKCQLLFQLLEVNNCEEILNKELTDEYLQNVSNKIFNYRKTPNKREEIIIRIDNCIIYCKPHFDINGNPNIMTNSSFEVFSALSEKGMRCIQKYTEIWESAIDMF